MFQHLADGPAVRHIAEFDRAHIVQIGSQVIYLTGAQDLAGILDLFIGQLVVIGNQDTGNILIHAVCSHLDLIPFQLPDQGLGPHYIDQLSFIMFFQILYCGKRSSNKVGVVRHHSQLLERQDIIFNASCRIIGNKDKLSPAVFHCFQEFPGTVDQSLANTYRTVNIQKKKPLIFYKSIILQHFPPAFSQKGRYPDNW